MKLTERERIVNEIASWAGNKNSSQFACLTGFAGTGKTHMIAELEGTVGKQNELKKLIDIQEITVFYTATTNKAVTVLQSHGLEAETIFKLLRLRVQKHQGSRSGLHQYSFNKDLRDSKNPKLIIIDEAGMLTYEMFHRHIRELAGSIKVLFVGDPYQRESVDKPAKVFNMGFKTWELTDQLRQQSQTMKNMVVELVDLVKNGSGIISKIPEVKIINDLKEYQGLIAQEFGREDWKESDSKIISWTNQAAINANAFVAKLRQGTSKIQEDTWYINNHFIPSEPVIPTDELVFVTQVLPSQYVHDYQINIKGLAVKLAGRRTQFFVPNNPQDKQRTTRILTENYRYTQSDAVDKTWLDLREAYSSTVDKAQGSTFKKVFVNMKDINKCKDLDSRNRLIYVAMSRASEEVYVFE